MESKLTIGSLFSGIGGLELGLEMTGGFRTLWQVEYNPWARAVLAKHWPEVERHEDVRSIGRHNVDPVDLLCGGFPCQPHSLAGRRKASEDERDLWGEFARIIGDIRPQWVLAENVPGLLSSEHGRFFGRILRDLATLGYDAEWDCIPASAIGAHHQRDRVFIVAYPHGFGRFRGTGNPGTFRGHEPEDSHSMAYPHGQHGGSANHGTSAHVWDSTEENVAYPKRKRLYAGPQPRVYSKEKSPGAWNEHPSRQGGWPPEPPVDRMAYGVPRRVDRIKGLGNAVVPQVARYIGSLILQAHWGRGVANGRDIS